MRFESPLLFGRLVRRYKRFLADIDLDDGRRIVVHTPNSGSMLGCATAGFRVAVSHQPSPTRKLAWTWELVDAGGGWVGIHTGRSNRIVGEAVAAGRIGPLRGYSEMRPEVRYGAHSRVDWLLTSGRAKCYLEVKNCTLRQGRLALFPDAVTERGAKHLRELQAVVRAGHRGVIFFLVNRGDCNAMAPADSIDPRYGALLRASVAAGVEALAYRTRIDRTGIFVERKLPVRLDLDPAAAG